LNHEQFESMRLALVVGNDLSVEPVRPSSIAAVGSINAANSWVKSRPSRLFNTTCRSSAAHAAHR
jgi:hypothetical protein